MDKNLEILRITREIIARITFIFFVFFLVNSWIRLVALKTEKRSTRDMCKINGMKAIEEVAKTNH